METGTVNAGLFVVDSCRADGTVLETVGMHIGVPYLAVSRDKTS
jgi:hypothetical protein